MTKHVAAIGQSSKALPGVTNGNAKERASTKDAFEALKSNFTSATRSQAFPAQAETSLAGAQVRAARHAYA